jgi:uncharacterized membrane protein
MIHRIGLLALLFGGMSAFCTTTYTYDVKPILEKHCTECHDYNGHDPDLTSYPFYSEKLPDQKSIVEKMLEKTSVQKMPPGNRPKLNQDQMAVIQRWMDDGLAQ